MKLGLILAAFLFAPLTHAQSIQKVSCLNHQTLATFTVQQNEDETFSCVFKVPASGANSEDVSIQISSLSERFFPSYYDPENPGFIQSYIADEEIAANGVESGCHVMYLRNNGTPTWKISTPNLKLPRAFYTQTFDAVDCSVTE